MRHEPRTEGKVWMLTGMKASKGSFRMHGLVSNGVTKLSQDTTTNLLRTLSLAPSSCPYSVPGSSAPLESCTPHNPGISVLVIVQPPPHLQAAGTSMLFNTSDLSLGSSQGPQGQQNYHTTLPGAIHQDSCPSFLKHYHSPCPQGLLPST